MLVPRFTAVSIGEAIPLPLCLGKAALADADTQRQSFGLPLVR